MRTKTNDRLRSGRSFHTSGSYVGSRPYLLRKDDGGAGRSFDVPICQFEFKVRRSTLNGSFYLYLLYGRVSGEPGRAVRRALCFLTRLRHYQGTKSRKRFQAREVLERLTQERYALIVQLRYPSSLVPRRGRYKINYMMCTKAYKALISSTENLKVPCRPQSRCFEFVACTAGR